jgi:oligoribonuclease
MKNRFNLVWIDLEMTGLNVAEDCILEIAAVITDKDLNLIAEGPSLVIHQSDEILESMNDWCKKQHALSGLTQDVKNSTISLEDAEKQVYDFVKTYCIPGQAILCGSSVWQDKSFINKYMPKLSSLFHYKIVDVSSIKELVIRWYPKSPFSDIKTEDKHRALPDTYESIEILKNYRTHFFISETTQNQ